MINGLKSAYQSGYGLKPVPAARLLCGVPHFLRHPDRAAWAALHAAAPQATVYTEAWWLDEVTTNAWGAVVETTPDGSYAAALPVPLRRRWRGLGPVEAYQPFFTQQLGLLTTPGAANDFAPFLAALPPDLRTYGQLHYANQVTAETAPDFRLGQRLTHHLDLTTDYATLAAGYHQNHRRNLKKSAGLLLTDEAAAAAAVIHLFQQTKGPELADVKPRHYALLQRLVAGLRERNRLHVWLAREPGSAEIVAGGLFAADARQLIYLLGGVSPAGRARGAMHAVVDALIRHEAGGGRLLDFEGSMVESVARFYAGFGARPVPYLTFERS